jgi:hypothetical protein
LRARLDTSATDGTETDFEIVLRDQDGDEVVSWLDSDGANGTTHLDVNLYVTEATTMYVQVHDWLDNDFDYDQAYTLVLDVLDVPDAALEPNGGANFAGNALLATPISDGVAQAACIASVGDDDWFKIEVPGESILDVRLDNAPAIASAVDYEVTVYGPAGNELNTLLDSNGGDGPSAVSFNSYAVGAGTYYVSVHDWLDNEWDLSRCYDVTVFIRPVPDDADEPNDVAAQAVALGIGATHQAHLASLGDVDWFSFAVPGEKIIEPQLGMVVGLADPELTVYTGTSEILLVRDTDGSGAPSSLIGAAYAPSAGTYTLRVHDWLDNDWGYAQPYTVVVALHDVPDAALEPNDTRATGTPITLGAPTQGYHASHLDLDYWTFTAAGSSVTVQLVTTVPTATDYEVILYNAAGTNLEDARDQNGGDGASTVGFTWSVTAGQTYAVRVGDFGDNDYDLTIPYTLTVTSP